jgi:hypothetical protein
MPNFKSMMDRPHLGAYDLEDLPKQEVAVTIKDVKREEVVQEGGKKDHKPVLYFKEPVKSMVCNTTNGDTISSLVGSERTEKWIGHRIIVFRTMDRQKGGKMGPCLRIRPFLADAAAAAPIQCEDCGKIIQAYGTLTPEQIAKASQAKFGANLCVPCAQEAGKQKAAADQEHNDTEGNTNGTNDEGDSAQHRQDVPEGNGVQD